MNSDRQVVPIVEGDQGEGYCDEVPVNNITDTCHRCGSEFVRKDHSKTTVVNPKRQYICDFCKRKEKTIRLGGLRSHR